MYEFVSSHIKYVCIRTMKIEKRISWWFALLQWGKKQVLEATLSLRCPGDADKVIFYILSPIRSLVYFVYALQLQHVSI